MANGPEGLNAPKGKGRQRVNYLEGQSAPKDIMLLGEKPPESPNDQKRLHFTKKVEVGEGGEQEQH